MCYVKCQLLGLTGFMQAVVVEVRLRSKKYQYFISYIVFWGLLAEYHVVWYSPLASTIFVGYELVFFCTCYFLLFQSFLDICEVATCHLSRLFFSLFIILFYFINNVI